MFKTQIKINKKDYLKCNLYYLKKYIGIKEIILSVFLFIAGAVLCFLFKNLFILIMCGVTLVLMGGALLFYIGTSNAGYKMEFEKRGATKWEISFDTEGFTVDTYERGGEDMFTEKRLFSQVDRIAILKDRVYIFANSAVMYYIKYNDFTEGNFIEFCEYIKTVADPSKFKMKAKRKQFPYGR